MDGTSDSFRSHSGRIFLEWYRDTLIAHGDKVLARARAAFPTKLISAKVAGIHWLSSHPSKAAELTAGYVGDYMQRICFMLAQHSAILNFTCLEMDTDHQEQSTMSRPERLVAEAMHACKVAGIPFAGENALPVGWDGHFEQIVRQLRHGQVKEGIHVAGFTFLRCTDDLVDTGSEAFARFTRFCDFMNDLPSFDKKFACDKSGNKHCHRCAHAHVIPHGVGMPSHMLKRVIESSTRTWHALHTVGRHRLADIGKTMHEQDTNAPHAKLSRTASFSRVPSRHATGLRRERSLMALQSRRHLAAAVPVQA